MSRSEEKTKRWRMWRPRFSVRTLAIFVTLVCVYFGLWEITKSMGMPMGPVHVLLNDRHGKPHKVRLGTENEYSPMPLVLWRDEGTGAYSKPTRRYYLWLFGPTIELPFKSGR